MPPLSLPSRPRSKSARFSPTSAMAAMAAMAPFLAIVLAASLAAPDPAHAAKQRPRAEKPEAAETAPSAADTAPASTEPSSILIAPHGSEAERKARTRSAEARRRDLAPAAAAWAAIFRREAAPFSSLLAEALRTLATTAGLTARNVCHPLGIAADRLAAALPQAPEPDLERQIRAALRHLADGARRCLEGRPTTAQIDLGQGARQLAQAAGAIFAWAEEGRRP